MTPVYWILAGLLLAAGVYGVVRWNRAHLTLREILQQTGEILTLKNPSFHRYPTPMISGDYFGHHLTLEGRMKQGLIRFLVTITLPHSVFFRLFLLHEERKTSLKPIAGLKLVTTLSPEFNHRFLVLSDRPDLCGVLFREYLCEKLLSLREQNWQVDVSGNEAHIEIHPETLNSLTLASCLKGQFELLNNMMVAQGPAT